MNLKNDHNVYILGAGFSCEANLPLLKDFLQTLRDSHEWLLSAGRKSEADAVETVLKFRLKATSAAYYVTLDLENIEELFSLASAVEGSMDIAIRTAIAATIDCIRKTKPLPPENLFVKSNGPDKLFLPAAEGMYPARYPKWAKPRGELEKLNPERVGPFAMSKYGFHAARLLGMFDKGNPRGENTFITFNYDTVLEEALSEIEIPFSYGLQTVAGDKSQVQAGPSECLPINVFKLHGSVNWIQDGQSIRECKTYEEVRELQEAPVLVPPTWKKVFQGPLQRVWESAVHKLSTATRIVLIGFSMPPTDMHFKYLLAAGLQNNVSLRKILFVNPDSDDCLRSRAKRLLRSAYIKSGQIEFAKLGLGAYTMLRHEPYLARIGRPEEYGMTCDFFPNSA